MCLGNSGEFIRTPLIQENGLVFLSERYLIHIIGHINLDLFTRSGVFDSRVCVICSNRRSLQSHVNEQQKKIPTFICRTGIQ